MDHGISEALLVTMFMLIESIAGFAPPAETPQIHRLPVAEIAERVCGRPCPVQAAYLRDQGILIDERLDLNRDSYAQSILVHELVHAAQHRDGTYSVMPPCRRHAEREYQAYWVQDEYLRRVGASNLVVMHKGNRIWPRCFDE